MIDYAKITGEIDGSFRFQVKMPTGETLFAPMLVMGNNIQVPSKDWIDANKDSFLAVVTYQGSSYYDPIIMGFLPVKGAKSEDFNTMERLLKVTTELVEQLQSAKVNTQIGPQPFMADTQQKLSEFKQELDDIAKLIEPLDIK